MGGPDFMRRSARRIHHVEGVAVVPALVDAV